MNDYMKKFILLLLLGLVSFPSFTQEEECGTFTSKREFNSESRKSARLLKRGSDPIEYKEIPVVFHILYDDQLVNVSDSALYVTLNDLNIKFNKSKFRFVLVSINRKPLSDFSWYQEYMSEPTTSTKIPSMRAPGSSKLFEIAETMSVNPRTTLNIFVQPKLYGALGFSFIPPYGQTSVSPSPKPPDGVWIRTSTFSTNPNSYNRNATLIHEIGHYLGLYHTFNGSFSCENFGLNCATTGDLVCDTPPFKQSSPRIDCTPACNIIILESDPWAGYVQDNHMDYLTHDCRRSFTNGQINRMHNYVSENRKDVYRTLSLPCLLDLDKDGFVTSKDFLIYLSCHGTTTEKGECYKCDVDGDGFVGSQDFLVFLTGIGQVCGD